MSYNSIKPRMLKIEQKMSDLKDQILDASFVELGETYQDIMLDITDAVRDIAIEMIKISSTPVIEIEKREQPIFLDREDLENDINRLTKLLQEVNKRETNNT